MNKAKIDLEILKLFLHRANKNTFANSSIKKSPSTRLNSSDYHFEEGNLIYHDTYFGIATLLAKKLYTKIKNLFGE